MPRAPPGFLPALPTLVEAPLWEGLFSLKSEQRSGGSQSQPATTHPTPATAGGGSGPTLRPSQFRSASPRRQVLEQGTPFLWAYLLSTMEGP